MPHCPHCKAVDVVKHEITVTGKPTHRCKDGHRQLVLHPLKSPRSEETNDLIDRLLLERLP
jgi:transposase-like protein